MAGIGIRLNKIFNRDTVLYKTYGILFSVSFSIGPMLLLMACLIAMYYVLGFNNVNYLERELFSCSVLYIFLFSLLTSAPFNSTLSKYITDRIYLEKYEDIRPCMYIGIIMTLSFSSLLGIPFYIYVVLVGHVAVYYVFTSFVAYLSLSLVWAAMVYNSIFKHYQKILNYFICGMLTAFVLSLLFHYLFSFSVTYSMLLSLAVGFLEIAILEYVNVLRNFPKNSYDYKSPLHYFRIYWKLILSNFLYIFGLFAHNFVFWALPWHIVVASSYVCNEPYDMASCIAMLTNLSASVIFLANIEMHFHERYSDYINSVLGGNLERIEISKDRLFRTLSYQMLSLFETQFVISIILYLVVNSQQQALGISGITMQIYPMLAVGYFIAYGLYSGMLFLYFFDDLNGSLFCSLIFAVISFVATLFFSRLSAIWYGSGFTLAAFCSYTYIYFRLRWVEKNIDYNVFCKGNVLKTMKGVMPSPETYHR